MGGVRGLVWAESQVSQGGTPSHERPGNQEKREVSKTKMKFFDNLSFLDDLSKFYS